MQWCAAVALAALNSLPVAVVAEESSATCSECHARQGQELAASVHPMLRCQECHGGAESYPVPPRPAPQGDIHPSSDAFDHGAPFVGKPGRTDIPNLCGDCHADVERMNPYGLRTDQLAMYKTSGHGKALFGRQDEKVAICTDCHGAPHTVLPASDPHSHTFPLNVPGTCASCHENRSLMGQYDLPTQVVEEYRQSVHGRLLLEHSDTSAPTCATCHGNHSAAPPGFASVGAVCGRCHEQAAAHFAASVHADQSEFRGCVQCHGGGPDRHDHFIERITEPTDVMIRRYVDLLASEPEPSPQRITEAIRPAASKIVNQVLPGCTDCHDEPAEDENLRKLFTLLDRIAEGERHYVKTAARIESIGRGVLLVDNQRFEFEDATTPLIALAPLQHTLDESLVREKVAEVQSVCDEVNRGLDDLEGGLLLRRRSLIPISLFAVLFSLVCYAKYKRLKAKPVQRADADVTRRGFLDWAIGTCTTIAGLAVAAPALLYLWPAARGGKSASVAVEGAAQMQPGASVTIQVGGKPVVVVRGRSGFRAFSAVCTHLGCLVKWDGAAGVFKCPCHAAVFDENGQVVSGPPPAPLPEYTTKEMGDQVLVSTS